MMCTTFAPSRSGRRAIIKRGVALLFAAALVGTTGCGSDSGTGPGNSVVGTYTLRQVAQERVPSEIYHGPYFDADNYHFYEQLIVSVDGGTVELFTDGTFTIGIDLSVNGDGQQASMTLWVDGTYDVQGQSIYFERNDGGTGSQYGQLSGGTIALGIEAVKGEPPKEYSFRK